VLGRVIDEMREFVGRLARTFDRFGRTRDEIRVFDDEPREIIESLARLITPLARTNDRLAGAMQVLGRLIDELR
jgi:predicted AAA+ superfamily ATPase